MADDSGHLDVDFVPIGLEVAICRSESRERAGDQIEAGFCRICALEEAIRRAGVHARDQIGDHFAAPQDNGDQSLRPQWVKAGGLGRRFSQPTDSERLHRLFSVTRFFGLFAFSFQ